MEKDKFQLIVESLAQATDHSERREVLRNAGDVFPVVIFEDDVVLPLATFDTRSDREAAIHEHGGIHDKKFVDAEEFEDLVGHEPEIEHISPLTEL